VILQGRLQRHDIWRSRLEFPAFHSDKIIHLLIQSIRFYLSAQCYFCKGLQLVYLQYNIFPAAGGSTYTPETKRANARARERERGEGGEIKRNLRAWIQIAHFLLRFARFIVCSVFGPVYSTLEGIFSGTGDLGLLSIAWLEDVLWATLFAPARATATAVAASQMRKLQQDVQTEKRSMAAFQIRVRQESQVSVSVLSLSIEATIQHVFAR